MAAKRLRSLTAKLVARLPELPRPWDIEVLCARLAAARGRPLTLHPVDLPDFPFGLWHTDGTRDRILYRSSATGYYRDHIVLHEICHMLAGHGTPVREVLPQRNDGQKTQAQQNEVLLSLRGAGRACSPVEEEIAEMFASTVLRLAERRRPEPLSPVERRAGELFGATGA